MDFGMIIAYSVSGLFVAAGIFNWDWFFERSRAKSTVSLFGRQGARYVYGGTGIFIMIFATLYTLSTSA